MKVKKKIALLVTLIALAFAISVAPATPGQSSGYDQCHSQADAWKTECQAAGLDNGTCQTGWLVTFCYCIQHDGNQSDANSFQIICEGY